MSMRFQQGETAIFAVPTTANEMAYADNECVVEVVGPFAQGQIIDFKGQKRQFQRACDYIVMFNAEVGAIVKDWQLRKLNPPEEPEAMTRTSDIDEEITA